jgi:hypothetical protein
MLTLLNKYLDRFETYLDTLPKIFSIFENYLMDHSYLEKLEIFRKNFNHHIDLVTKLNRVLHILVKSCELELYMINFDNTYILPRNIFNSKLTNFLTFFKKINK